MSVGFDGTVLAVGSGEDKYATKVDYGNIRCTDGRTRRIVIQYAHSKPLVKHTIEKKSRTDLHVNKVL
jgi:hypothetical protein